MTNSVESHRHSQADLRPPILSESYCSWASISFRCRQKTGRFGNRVQPHALGAFAPGSNSIGRKNRLYMVHSTSLDGFDRVRGDFYQMRKASNHTRLRNIARRLILKSAAFSVDIKVSLSLDRGLAKTSLPIDHIKSRLSTTSLIFILH
jgi:hypothetical protein